MEARSSEAHGVYKNSIGEAAPLALQTHHAALYFFNNNTWVDPAVPLYVSKGKFGLSRELNFETLVYDIDYDDVVDIVLESHNEDGLSFLHPMHLHGHKFWVVEVQDFKSLAETDRNNDTHHYHYRNYEDALRCDTYPVSVAASATPSASSQGTLACGCSTATSRPTSTPACASLSTPPSTGSRPPPRPTETA